MKGSAEDVCSATLMCPLDVIVCVHLCDDLLHSTRHTLLHDPQSCTLEGQEHVKGNEMEAFVLYECQMDV